MALTNYMPFKCNTNSERKIHSVSGRMAPDFQVLSRSREHKHFILCTKIYICVQAAPVLISSFMSHKNCSKARPNISRQTATSTMPWKLAGHSQGRLEGRMAQWPWRSKSNWHSSRTTQRCEFHIWAPDHAALYAISPDSLAVYGRNFELSLGFIYAPFLG